MNKPDCPYDFDVEFGKQLVKYLGGDVSKVKKKDCWWDFAKKFPELLNPAMKYFEEATAGAPSGAAYYLMVYGAAPLEWAMRVVENAKTGNPSWEAYKLTKYGAPLKWAMKVIENAKTGYPSSAAYWLVRDCKAPLEWYEKLKLERGWK